MEGCTAACEARGKLNMVQELLVSGEVGIEDFKALVRTYKLASDAPTLMLLESQPTYIIEPEERQNLLLFMRFDRDFDFASHMSGRIFHRYGEMRWEKLASSVQVVFSGMQEYKPALQNAKEKTLDDHKKVCRTYFLFGKRLDDEQRNRIGPAAQAGDFAEVRIPRLLRYPLPASATAEYVRLAVYEYVAPTTGAIIAYRFHDLLPFQKPGRKKTS